MKCECWDCGNAQPQLLAENEELWRLLGLCKRQWRVSMNGRDSLDFGVLIEAARALHIRRDRLFFEKLGVFEETVIEIWDKTSYKIEAQSDEEYEQSLKGATENFGNGK